MMELKHKRLAALWDHIKFSDRAKKIKNPIDGAFILSSIFSISAYASKKSESIETKFSKQTAHKLMVKLKGVRDQFSQLDLEFTSKYKNLDVCYMNTKKFQIDVDRKFITPETAMFIKIFLTIDDYFTHLYMARTGGELTESETLELRKACLDQLIRLLNEVNQICLSFHKARKSIGKSL
ncbi:hypothetical protein Q5N41_16705 [Vibrio cholerae]|uniref:hypothetical protein n=1 Tax=Vibrio TaxID=662 RepID=UPI0005B33BE7|nr:MULTISPECIES: hypothetical protein [Vibrio]EGR0546782.1 hypothetical protein [Vibrio cholerae]EGR0574582.1 hypothetical protein [Vibrio cholerae]EGR1117028.1 hypothetical protein [Vibrio cholerae]EGR2026345.1 hypothetical protein [Vibrio cholerae]EGR4447754.1 hypothetical protein [Vibrio cholerae]